MPQDEYVSEDEAPKFSWTGKKEPEEEPPAAKAFKKAANVKHQCQLCRRTSKDCFMFCNSYGHPCCPALDSCDLKAACLLLFFFVSTSSMTATQCISLCLPKACGSFSVVLVAGVVVAHRSLTRPTSCEKCDSSSKDECGAGEVAPHKCLCQCISGSFRPSRKRP